MQVENTDQRHDQQTKRPALFIGRFGWNVLPKASRRIPFKAQLYGPAVFASGAQILRMLGRKPKRAKRSTPSIRSTEVSPPKSA